MVTVPKQRRAFYGSLGLGFVLALSFTMSGCTSMGKNNFAALDTHLMKGPDAAKAGGASPGSADSQHFYLEYRGDKKKPLIAKGTLTGPTTVQQAMQKAGAFKKYRRLTAEIQRPLPNGTVHILPCEYDLATKRINPQFDYAVLPGDKIVVSEDTSTIINDMLDSSLGPIGSKLLGGKKKGKGLPEQYKMQE